MVTSGTLAQGPNGARAQNKRALIVTAAHEVFLAEGFDASMDAVAARAGVSKVTVYNHFKNKQSLFLAIIHDALDAALATAVELVESHLSDSTDIEGDLVEACRVWVAGIGSPDMLALRNLVAGGMLRMPELGAAWQQRGPERFHPVVANALRALNERGELAIEDVDLAVLQLSGLVVSPQLVYGAYGSRVPPEVTDHLVRRGVDMFLTYYRDPARWGGAKRPTPRPQNTPPQPRRAARKSSKKTPRTVTP